jgi:hypothetical protein
MVVTGQADDPQVMRQEAIDLEKIQRRQQHTQGQVARAAQQHQHFSTRLVGVRLFGQCFHPMTTLS